MSETTWFTEYVDEGHGMTFRNDKTLIKKVTKYQKLEIFENKTLGRIMLLDDVMMLTQRDEYIYHEMLVHPGLLAHPNPERVLVIGGGDGGTLREVVKHPMVKEAILCEIDEEVVNYSREFLPFTAVGLDHPKSTLFVGDGIKFIQDHKGEFDVVIVDSTDPVGFAEGLFRAPFYRDVKAALKPDGILTQQTESPLFDREAWKQIYVELDQVFNNVACYAASIPMYPSGFWTFTFSSDVHDPWAKFSSKRAEALGELGYYTPKLQRSAFDLPRFAIRDLKAMNGDA
jgi:spermidine synthase